MPTARSMAKKRCGLPIAAIACTGRPENSRSGFNVPYFIATAPVASNRIAEAAIAVDDDDFAVALQSIVLQSVVAHNDVTAGVDQQLCRRGTITPYCDRNSAAVRQQDGFIADLVGIIGGLDEPRRPG
jgi:hypothetical protein